MIISGADVAQLIDVLSNNEPLMEGLRRLDGLDLPDWYLGAGCIAQTIWNVAHQKVPTESILDYDVVYFDSDLSEHAESEIAATIAELFRDLSIRPDVKNQARVHLWYEAHFGYRILPYRSTEDAITTWPTTSTAIGVRPLGRQYEICAPFGTEDLLRLRVRANRVQITPEVYAAKTDRWIEAWPGLQVLPWEEGVGVEGRRRAV
jgi:hypothetical protein